MALSLVNSYHTYSGNAQTAVAVSVGNLIIVGYSYNNTLQSVTCTDNSGGGSNTYNQAASLQSTTATSSGHVFYAIAKASETLTITCTAETDNGIAVHVVSGNNTTLASVLDGTPATSTSNYATSFTSGTLTTTNANDYLFIMWFQNVSATTVTENGTGFTLATLDSGQSKATLYKIVSSIGSYSDSITVGTNSPQNSILAGFAAGSSGPAVYQSMSSVTGSSLATRF